MARSNATGAASGGIALPSRAVSRCTLWMVVTVALVSAAALPPAALAGSGNPPAGLYTGTWDTGGSMYFTVGSGGSTVTKFAPSFPCAPKSAPIVMGTWDYSCRSQSRFVAGEYLEGQPPPAVIEGGVCKLASGGGCGEDLRIFTAMLQQATARVVSAAVSVDRTGRAHVPVRCYAPGLGRCAVRLALQLDGKPAGSARVAVPHRRTRTVAVRLSAPARQALAARGRIELRAIATTRHPGVTKPRVLRRTLVATARR
jgi:hypothetical protein